MQRMTIIGLRLIEMKLAESMYKLLPDSKVYIEDKKLIVEAIITEAEKEYISDQYNKAAKLVIFEDI